MKALTTIRMTLFLGALLAVPVYAVPPANDNFVNAQTLQGLSGEVVGTNAEATRQVGEPIHAMNRGGASVWYRYVSTTTGVVRVETADSDYNTLLAVYTGTSLASLKLIGSNDNFGPISRQSQVVFAAQPNTTYYIAVDGYNDDGLGAATGELRISWLTSASPVIDPFETTAGGIYFHGGQRAESNVGAGKQPGEPDHAANPGGRSVWFRWVAPTNSGYRISTKGSVKADGSGPMNTLLAIYSGSAVENLTPIASDSGYESEVLFNPIAGQTYRIAVDGFNSGQGADTGTINFSLRVSDSTKDLDFDGDRRADISLFRPSTGVWYTQDSVTGALRAAKWGVAGDVPIPGRYDSDDRIDYNVFRPDTGTWWTLGSVTGATSFRWGLNTDIPFVFRTATYDYTGVFRPSNGNWYIYIGSGYTVNFGRQGDIPVPADYDGDGHDNIAIYRPTTGEWWFLNQITGAQTAVQFGIGDDIPVPADYDGDGVADLAAYRPSDGNWFLKRSFDGSTIIRGWGIPGDIPQPGDYNGDAIADYAVYRPSEGTWYILHNITWVVRQRRFGLAGDLPITYSGVMFGSK